MKKRYILLFLVILFGIVIFVMVASTPAETPTNVVPVNGTQTSGNTLSPEPAPVAGHDRIRVTTPKPGQRISSPLTLKGESAGWYFEGSFPIELTDDKGNVIAQKYVTAQGDWMTSDFVPFLGTLEFTVPKGVTHGYLVFKKDNPSGEARFDDEFSLPVTF